MTIAMYIEISPSLDDGGHWRSAIPLSAIVASTPPPTRRRSTSSRANASRSFHSISEFTRFHSLQWGNVEGGSLAVGASEKPAEPVVPGQSGGWATEGEDRP